MQERIIFLFELKNSNMDMYVLQDIYIETEDGRGAQIDFIVITEKITFFIECKNLVGNIDVDSKGNFVRTVTYGRKKIQKKEFILQLHKMNGIWR